MAAQSRMAKANAAARMISRVKAVILLLSKSKRKKRRCNLSVLALTRRDYTLVRQKTSRLNLIVQSLMKCAHISRNSAELVRSLLEIIIRKKAKLCKI